MNYVCQVLVLYMHLGCTRDTLPIVNSSHVAEPSLHHRIAKEELIWDAFAGQSLGFKFIGGRAVVASVGW